MSETSPFIVSADWLQERLGAPALTIIDGSWYLPVHQRDGRSEYNEAHIPGALFFDQDKIVDPESPLPHTLPRPGLFGQFACSMGIDEKDTIVVYDGPGMFSAARVWWMLRTMGAKEVYILDGGFDRWKEEGRPVTSEPTKTAPGFFEVEFDESRVVSLDEMRGIVERGDRQVADARPAGRFTGTEPEPRAGMRSGHMPGAKNVPATSLSRNGSLLPIPELKERLEAAGIDLSRPVVTSCGSGVTAAVISLALASVGHTDNALYDGSWSEWGGREDTPVVTGSD
ncbi:3-mercaptopyruvate sulfurtransferase [Aquamicrobium zhengzhouense]|uniref:3-mercaptopyruvate sulfurtransferase n=1 Tax=Aquamicrobium zhengzhouense TaxID=2781738 RepID=A0ABS0SBJ5_9HYPH|nr:3-mercaptopyruvate sulfurtransferase [Aquamicrobium zhengzhouense]MBI1620658.1 3-mercaptopyruvate sulfurtransferase [Aquamicrobium zhengzhouense]